MTNDTKKVSSGFSDLRRRLDDLEHDIIARERQKETESEERAKSVGESLGHANSALRKELLDAKLSAQTDISNYQTQLSEADDKTAKLVDLNKDLLKKFKTAGNFTKFLSAELFKANDDINRLQAGTASDRVVLYRLKQRLTADQSLRSLVMNVRYNNASGAETTVFQGLIYQAMVKDPNTVAQKIAFDLLAEDSRVSEVGMEPAYDPDDVFLEAPSSSQDGLVELHRCTQNGSSTAETLRQKLLMARELSKARKPSARCLLLPPDPTTKPSDEEIVVPITPPPTSSKRSLPPRSELSKFSCRPSPVLPSYNDIRRIGSARSLTSAPTVSQLQNTPQPISTSTPTPAIASEPKNAQKNNTDKDAMALIPSIPRSPASTSNSPTASRPGGRPFHHRPEPKTATPAPRRPRPLVTLTPTPTPIPPPSKRRRTSTSTNSTKATPARAVSSSRSSSPWSLPPTTFSPRTEALLEKMRRRRMERDKNRIGNGSREWRERRIEETDPTLDDDEEE